MIWLAVQIAASVFIGAVLLHGLVRMAMPKRKHNPLLADHMRKLSR